MVRLFHGDRLGSTQVVTDWNGAIYRQMRYFAYGEVRGRFDAAGATANFAEDARWEFTGYETDFAGLDYAGARFFDPELGQFGSHDPAGQYASPYAYGPGDPINGTDPSGTDFWDVAQYSSPLMGAVSSIVKTYQATGSWGKALGQFAKSYAINAGISIITYGVGQAVGAIAAYAYELSAQAVAQGVTSSLQFGVSVPNAISAVRSGDANAIAMAAVNLVAAAHQFGGALGGLMASGNEQGGLLADNSDPTVMTDVPTLQGRTLMGAMEAPPRSSWPEGATDWLPYEGFIYGNGEDTLAPWEVVGLARAGYAGVRAAGSYLLGVDAATAAGGGAASQGVIATRGFRMLFGREGLLNSNQYLRVGLGRDGGSLVFRASGKLVARFRESGHIVLKTFGKL